MNKKQKGSALYFTIIIMGVLFILGLSSTNMFISQLRMIEDIGESVTAFYAADTGIEEILYSWDDESFDELDWDTEHELAEDTYYMYEKEGPVLIDWYYETEIKSVGLHRGTRRAIWIVRRTHEE